MMILITYDVDMTDSKGARRLRRIAKACQDYGQRVQYSVFECILDPAHWTVLRDRLVKEMDLEKDSLRFYKLGANWRRKVEQVGKQRSFDQEGTLIL